MNCFEDDKEAMEDYNILLDGYKNANTAKTILLKNNGKSLKYQRDGSRSEFFSQLATATNYKKAVMLKSAIYYNEFLTEPDISEVYPSLTMKDKNFGIQKPSQINKEYLTKAINETAWNALQNAYKNKSARKDLGKVYRTNDPTIFKAENPKAIEKFFNRLFSKEKQGEAISKIAHISEKDPTFVVLNPTTEQLNEIGINEAKKQYDSLIAESAANYISNLEETHMPDIYDNALDDENLIDYDIPNSDESENTKLRNFIKFHDSEIAELSRKYATLDNKKSFAKDKNEISDIVKGMARISSRIQKLNTQKSKLMEGSENMPSSAINERIKNRIYDYGMQELSDAEILLDSKNSSDILEAKKIINWYSQLGEFDKKTFHPLFVSNTKVTDKELKESLIKLASKAKKLDNFYNEKIKKMTLEMLQQHENYSKLAESNILTSDDIFDTAIPDINTFSEFALNPYFTYGNLRKETAPDIIPSLAMEYFIKTTVKRESRARKWIEEIDAQIAALPKEFRNDHNYLYQEENDERTGYLINAFTNKWHNMLQYIEKSYEDKINNLQNINTANIYKYRALNTIGNFLDLSNLPELVNKFQTTKSKKPEIDESYKRNLIDKYGKYVYKKIIDNQTNLIDQYLEVRKIMISDILNYNKVDSIYNLPIEQQQLIHEFDLANDPYKISLANENGVVSSLFNNVEINVPVNSRYIVVLPKEEEEHGFVDKRFDTIKNNNQLHDFWNSLSNALEYINNIIVSAGNGKIQFNSLPDMQRSIYEDFLGKKISLRDRTILGLTVGNVSGYAVNDETKVNASSLRSLEPKIKKETAWYINQYEKLLSKPSSEKRDNAIKNLISKNVSEKYKEKALEQFENKDYVSAAIYKSVRQGIMDQQSLDIPKMIKYYLAKASRIDSQIESIPTLNAILELYRGIKDPNGKERKKAILRFTSWYNRIARGYYKQHSEKGTNIKFKTSDQVKKIDTLKNRLEATSNVNEIKSIQDQMNELYRSFDPKMVTSGIISFTMFTALAYALPNGVANRMYSVIIGSLEDRKGERWTPGNNQKSYNFISKKDMKFMHRLAGGLLSGEKEYIDELDKCQLFINKLGLFQDMRNEKQKASRRMGKEDFTNKFNPFYFPITKPEWQNQTQIFLNVLQDIKIKDNKGNEYPVFDGNRFTIYNNVNNDGIAKGEKYTKDGKTIESKGGKLILKPEFKNEENIKNWIDMDGDKFLTYFIKAWEANLVVNGDYSNFGGMMAKETDAGKLLSLFLTYMGMYMYRNYGAGVNLATGTYRQKSIMQSLTPTEMGTLAAENFLSSGMGLASATLAGGIISGANKALLNHAKTEIGVMKQMTTVLKMTLYSTMEVAAQMATFGKLTPKINIKKLSDKYEIPEQKLRDMYSLTRAIGIKMGLMITILGALASMYCNDKNDPNCKKRREVANLIANFLSSLQDSVFQELSPIDLANSIFRRGSIMRMADRVQTALDQADQFVNNMLFGYTDVVPSGEHKGMHKIVGGLEKLAIPTVMRTAGIVGTPATAGRLFNENLWEKILMESMKTDEEKADDIQKKKRNAEVENLSKYMTTEQANRKANALYPSVAQIKSKLMHGKDTKYNWKPYYNAEIKKILENK